MIKCSVVIFAIVVAMPTVLCAQTISTFEGRVDVEQQKLNLKVRYDDGSSVAVDLEKANDSSFKLKSKIDHLKVKLFDISSELYGSLEIVEKEDSRDYFLRGSIKSRYSLINYKPAYEFSGYFTIKNDRLYFESLSWGNLASSGYIGLIPPHEVDLKLKCDEVRASDLLSLLGCDLDESGISGVITGKVDISGFLDRVLLKGQLLARNGFVGESEYSIIRLKFEGLHPIVYVSDSTFFDIDGLSFKMDGSLNLEDQCDFTQGLSGLKMSPLIHESDDFTEWTIRRREEEGSSRLSEFKYKLRKQSDDGLSVEDDSGMIGVESGIKF